MEAASKCVFNGFIWRYPGYRQPVQIKEAIVYEEVPARDKGFSNGCIAKTRIIDLISNYRFDLRDIIVFGGWEDHGEGTRIPRTLKHLFQFNLDDINPDSINLLTGIAENCFKKLCKPRIDPSKIKII